MPSAHIIVETPVRESFRVAALRGLFDLPPGEKTREEWQVSIPYEDKSWNIGLLVGTSGSGKTTIAKRFFPTELHTGFLWGDASVLEDFPQNKTMMEITTMLSSVGFSSPPSWLKPFSVLSNGQKFRVEIARILCENRPLFVVDEFTSIVDRNAACIGSTAISRTIRQQDRQGIFLSCHRDIIPWLMPDWIYDTDTKEFYYARGHLQRPKIEIRLYRSTWRAWDLFKNHHYLTASLAKNSSCFIGCWQNAAVVFAAVLGSMRKGHVRIHRLVVLPDFQGVGIGIKFLNVLGVFLRKEGKVLHITSGHPAIGRSLAKNPEWLCTKKPSRGAAALSFSSTGLNARGRLVCSFQFKGESNERRIAV